MALLPTGLFGAFASKALGFGFVDVIARGRLTGVAAVFGQPLFEFVEPLVKRSDHLLLIVKPGTEVLDEIHHGIDASFVYGYDVFTRHHGGCIIFRLPPSPQSVTSYPRPE
jgi:hypothetical protein